MRWAYGVIVGFDSPIGVPAAYALMRLLPRAAPRPYPPAAQRTRLNRDDGSVNRPHSSDVEVRHTSSEPSLAIQDGGDCRFNTWPVAHSRGPAPSFPCCECRGVHSESLGTHLPPAPPAQLLEEVLDDHVSAVGDPGPPLRLVESCAIAEFLADPLDCSQCSAPRWCAVSPSWSVLAAITTAGSGAASNPSRRAHRTRLA